MKNDSSMEGFIGGVILTLFAVFVHAKTTITSTDNSKYEVIFNSEIISTHTTSHKAIESALNVLDTKCCTVYVRRALELRIVKTTEVTETEGTVELTWDMPSSREDGSALLESDILGYEMEVNGEQLIEVGKAYSTTLTLPKGTYVFRIRTVAEEGPGAFSQPIQQEL